MLYPKVGMHGGWEEGRRILSLSTGNFRRDCDPYSLGNLEQDILGFSASVSTFFK